MEDLRFALIAGIEIPIPECKLILKQPKIKDIAFLGDINFFTGAQTLGLHKSMFMSEDN